jgi:hypothetical protein
MSDWTLDGLMARFETVLEAQPFGLKKTTVPFTHDHQPNEAIEDRYTYRDGGLVQTDSMTAMVSVRIDRIELFVARKMAFDGHTQQRALEAQLVAIERALIADGLNSGYHVIVDGSARRVTQPKNKDLLIASCAFLVDYDFLESVQ